MNFNFNMNSNFSMSNGKMVIKNGNQTIKMGPNGMEISNGASNNIVMSSSGIQVFNRGSSVYSVDISSNNGISINGRPVQTNCYTTTNNYNSQNYYEEDNEEEEEEESIDEGPDEDENGNFFNMGNNYYQYNNGEVFNNVYYENEEEGEEEQYGNEEEREEIRIGLDPEQISALPVMTYSSTMEKQAKMVNKKSTGPTSNNFCSICIVDYKNGDKLRCLPCFHRFHQKCIDEWLIIKNACPLCKSIIE